jgi:hypothetical protein
LLGILGGSSAGNNSGDRGELKFGLLFKDELKWDNRKPVVDMLYSYAGIVVFMIVLVFMHCPLCLI